MTTPDSPNAAAGMHEMQQLFEEQLAGRISAEDRERLVAFLKTDDVSRETFARLMVQHDLLKEFHRQESVADAGMFAEATRQRVEARARVENGAEDVVLAAEAIRQLEQCPVQTRHSWRRWPAWLAAAAVLLLSVGVWFWHNGQGPGSMGPRLGQVSRVSGDVFVTRGAESRRLVVGESVAEGDRIETRSNSYCQIECADQTLMALNAQSDMRLTRMAKGRPGEMALESGAVYVESARRDEPLKIISRGDQYEVVGTKFMVKRGKVGGMLVLDGVVRHSLANSAVYVMPGQISTGTGSVSDPIEPGQRSSLITVAMGGQAGATELLWLGNLGLPGRELAGKFEQARMERAPLLLDMSRYRVMGGSWRATTGAEGAWVRQEDATKDLVSIILFEAQRWKAATFSLEFRILNSTAEAPSVSMELSNAGSPNLEMDEFGFVRQLAVLRDGARENGQEGWIAMQIEFDVKNPSRLDANLSAWPVKEPMKLIGFQYQKNDQNSRVRNRAECGVGLLTEGCSVEFRDLRVKTTAPQ